MPSSTDSSTDDSVQIGPDFRAFTPINEHPLPFSENFDEFVESHPMLDEDEVEHVDTLHTEYVNRIAKTDEWVVFEVLLHGYENKRYIWNRQLGEGFCVPTDEWQFGGLMEVLALVREADDAFDPNEPPIEPDTGGCPYCDAGADAMSSSTRPSGSFKQTCSGCGRSRIVG